MTREFEDFADQFTDELGVQIHEKAGLQSCTIRVVRQQGAQGTYEAVALRPEGEENAVTASLTEAYENYQKGADISTLASQMAEELTWALRDIPGKEENFMADYDEVKPRLFVDLVSADRNQDMLWDVPHKSFEDMAMVYRAMVDPRDEGKGSVLITDDLLQQYGVTTEQLHEDALENSVKMRPVFMAGLSETIGLGRVSRDDEMLFVASVPVMSHGAGVIAYPGFLDQASKELGADLFVLPSSIHEVLLLRDNGTLNASELTGMVQQVNQQEVRPEERLSENAFHYDSKEHVFERTEQFQERQKLGLVIQGRTEETQEKYAEKEDRSSLLDNLSDKASKVKEEKAKTTDRRCENRGRKGEAI